MTDRVHRRLHGAFEPISTFPHPPSTAPLSLLRGLAASPATPGQQTRNTYFRKLQTCLQLLCVSRYDLGVLRHSIHNVRCCHPLITDLVRGRLHTLQVASGDPWPESLVLVQEDGEMNWPACAYMCTFITFACWIALEVSVAVLLENFVAASRRMEEREKLGRIRQRKMLSEFKNPMEPLLAKLAASFVDHADLTHKIRTVYEVPLPPSPFPPLLPPPSPFPLPHSPTPPPSSPFPPPPSQPPLPHPLPPPLLWRRIYGLHYWT
jgi:hypothetical protein